MEAGQAPGLAAIRHLKRAQRLARESVREIARARDVDTVGHIVVRRGDEEDITSVNDLIRLSLTDYEELDVIVVAPIKTPQIAEGRHGANGAKEKT
jgi:hypothetical protein